MKEIIELPEGVSAEVTDTDIKVTGKLGELKKQFIEPSVKQKLEGNSITLTSTSESRKTKRIIKTYKAHVKNMVKGVTQGFEYEMKIVFTHFPVTVKVEGQKLRIDNFIGERSPRYAKIMPGVEIKAAKQDLKITGIDIDAVSQTAGNIENKTRVIGRDSRIFQDGIYITKKAE